MGASGASGKKILPDRARLGIGQRPEQSLQGAGRTGGTVESSFEFALKNKGRYRIGGVDWFSWRDEPAGTGGNCVLCETFGLLNVDCSAKPSIGGFTGFTGGHPRSAACRRR